MIASVRDDGSPALVLHRRELGITHCRKGKVGKLRDMVGSGEVRITRAGISVSPRCLSRKAHQQRSDEAKDGHRIRGVAERHHLWNDRRLFRFELTARPILLSGLKGELALPLHRVGPQTNSGTLARHEGPSGKERDERCRTFFISWLNRGSDSRSTSELS